MWSTKKADRVNHKNGCNMTVHRDYANKSCPGDYLYNRHGEIAAEVNRRLGVADTAPDAGAAQGVTVYTVKKGDTLSQIAAKYGTTYQAIAAYNGIKNPNAIRVGQKIKIPASTAPAALKKGDRVKALNAVTYDGKPFRTYYDTYDVIQVSGRPRRDRRRRYRHGGSQRRQSPQGLTERRARRERKEERPGPVYRRPSNPDR